MKSVISVSLSEDALDYAKTAVIERRFPTISAFVNRAILVAPRLLKEVSQ